MAYKKIFLFLILGLMGSLVQGMIIDDDENVPLLSDSFATNSSLLEQPSEIIYCIVLYLQDTKDIVAFCSTCTQLHELHELKLLTKFAQQLANLKILVNTKQPFFNEDQEQDLKEKLNRLVEIRELMQKNIKTIKPYENEGRISTNLAFYNLLQSNYKAFKENIKQINHPLYIQLKSLTKHNLIYTDTEEDLVNKIAAEINIDSKEEPARFWQKMVHTIGRNRKIIFFGTLTLGFVGIAGVHYLLQYSPFSQQSFMDSYDSSQTWQSYTNFSYNGHIFQVLDIDRNIYTSMSGILRPNWCLPNGNSLRWGFSSIDGKGLPSYCYISPTEEPPHATYGVFECKDNKTVFDAVTFLQEQCGFNFDFWYSAFNKIINDANFYTKGVYCTPDESNNTLICARFFSRFRTQVSMKDISEINLANVEHLYRDSHALSAILFGGTMGAFNLALWGFLFLSWCLG